MLINITTLKLCKLFLRPLISRTISKEVLRGTQISFAKGVYIHFLLFGSRTETFCCRSLGLAFCSRHAWKKVLYLIQIRFLLFVRSRLTINWSLLQLMLKSWSTEWNCAQLCITLWSYLNVTIFQLLTLICLEYWLKISTMHNGKPFMLSQVLSISYWYSSSWWQNINMAQWFDMCQFCYPNSQHWRSILAPEINYKQNSASNSLFI